MCGFFLHLPKMIQERYEIAETTNIQDENSFVDHVRRKLLPRAVSPNPTGGSSSVPPRLDETPPSIQEKDTIREKRQLFKSGKKKKTKAKNTRKDKQVPRRSPSEPPDRSPSWSPRNTPTPQSSLKSSFGSQEFDQMLRNNIGSPLISFLPCQSPCNLPTFTSNTQACQLNILHSPTPLPPQTSIITPFSVAMVPSESVPREATPYWPVMSVSVPVAIKSDTAALVHEQQSKTLRSLPSMNRAVTICDGPATALRATAFQIVSQT